MHVHKVCECSAFPLETWMHISNYLDDWLIIARSRDVLAFYICPKLINILNRTTCSVLHWYFHEAPAVGCLPPKSAGHCHFYPCCAYYYVFMGCLVSDQLV